MKIKTSELTGPALDWAAAKADGIADKPVKLGSGKPITRFVYVCRREERCTLDKAEHIFDLSSGGYYAPAHSWSQGGPIIEREMICIDAGDGSYAPQRKWSAWLATNVPLTQADEIYGPTPLIAAMRCFVASKLGNEVDVPEELS